MGFLEILHCGFLRVGEVEGDGFEEERVRVEVVMEGGGRREICSHGFCFGDDFGCDFGEESN